MYEYFKNIIQKSTCSSIGACSVNPSLNSLYEILLSEIREISSYLVKLKEFGLLNQKAMDLSIKVLATFLINTNFNEIKYLNLLLELYSQKIEIKTKYIEYCTKNQFPCEIINKDFEINSKSTINELIEQADNMIKNRQKNCDKRKLALFELITLFSRLSAINITKIKKIDNSFNKYDYEILRFFALTNSYSIRTEKIIRRIKEFCKISLDIRKKLYSLYDEHYGKKENASFNKGCFKGHGILVSGDDLSELYDLLETLEKSNIKEEINVYTNGTMLMAHFYPYFKNNKYLKGHFGSDNAEYDFSIFPGSILITSNFIQKIDNLYKGEIFSNKLISYNRVFDIKNNDYLPLIESSLKTDGFMEDTKIEKINICFDERKITKTVKELNENEIVIITGQKENNFYLNEYKDKKIINSSCSCESDIPFDILEALKDKNINLTVFFTQCNLESLEIVFSLLNSEINIYLSNCPYVLVNPHILEALKENFNVKIID